MPKVTEQNDEYIFELRDGVFISAAFATEKKLRFQLWRQAVLLPPAEGNIFLPSFRDKLVAQARRGFNEPSKPDAIAHIEEDMGVVAVSVGDRSGGGKRLHDRVLFWDGPATTEKLVT